MEARFYEARRSGRVQCKLCHHFCFIQPGETGLCGVRENRKGQLITRVYGRLVAEHVDPIEKKPIFHLLPGSLAYSIATVGCNFKCRFCQNYAIAHLPHQIPSSNIQGSQTTPQQVVQSALAANCRSIAYTYTEPTVFFEFVYDTAKLAHRQGLRNIMVTNGYIGPEALKTLLPYLDAANVDLKSFSDQFYQQYVGARLKPVLKNISTMSKAGILVEVTTLVIPGLNDKPSELEDLARFLSRHIGPRTPWHVSRFHPTYKMTDRPPTPESSLATARQIGLEAGLRYVYVGNLPQARGEDTACPECQQTIIRRHGFRIIDQAMEGRCCGHCGAIVEDIIVA